MVDKPANDEVRPEVAPPDPAWVGSFHSGAHPQRPIPPDLSEAEQAVLERERQRLHADVAPAGEPAAEEASRTADDDRPKEAGKRRSE